jgi:hypothetical protein
MNYARKKKLELFSKLCSVSLVVKMLKGKIIEISFAISKKR